MQVLGSSRDERAAPLFVYILEHSDHRGALEDVYLSAIEALGKLGGDAESVAALKKVLYRGEWWAPLPHRPAARGGGARAARLRIADAAQQALDEAASDGAARRAPRRARRR